MMSIFFKRIIGKLCPFINLRCPTLVDKVPLCKAKECTEGVLREWQREHLQWVAILAPWIEDSTFSPGDGYIKRIAVIDHHALRGYGRIYIYNSPFWYAGSIGIHMNMENKLVYLVYNSGCKKHRIWIEKLINQSRLCYIHSIYRLLPSIHQDRRPEALLPSLSSETFYIWDVHGAVSAELALSGVNHETVEIAKWAEAECMKRVNVIIGVNHAMVEYLANLNRTTPKQNIIIPIIEKVFALPLRKEAVSGMPVVIYSGGIQKWQLIEETLSAVNQAKTTAEYRFFINDEAAFQRILQENDCHRQIYWKQLSKEALYREYEKAHYGFLLRDRSIVNQVACPTKLIEYLQYGIIPILKSSDIGDFGRLELKYVSVDDFIQGKLPTSAAYKEMQTQNFILLGKLYHVWENGIRILKKTMYDITADS